MYSMLESEGYVGQHEARRAVCLMAYRHLRRSRMLHLEGVSRASLPLKENLLMLGPTGCGKTYMVELLFNRLLRLPTIVIDMTNFTESGYVGSSVKTILPRLLHAAEGNKAKASIGIICLDEIDKLAGATSQARFAGAGTTKDVSGFGVQRELLKLLDSSEADITDESGFGSIESLQTHDVPFIACGAFSGLKATIRRQQGAGRVGFGVKNLASRRCGVAEGITPEEVMPVANFTEYGMMPELIGRFGRVIPLQPMGPDDLRRILTGQVIQRYENELAAEGVRIEFDDRVLDFVVENCLRMETGARSIAAVVSTYLEKACFDVYSISDPADHVISLEWSGDAVRCQLRDRYGKVVKQVE
jgi:ATP-dependent Clp protease ATP-binding subunit ClpX